MANSPSLFAADALTSDGQPPQPPNGPPAVNTHIPTPTLADAELAGRIRTLFSRARSQRQNVLNQWNKNRRIFSNRTWAQGRHPGMPSPEVPEIRPIIASCVAWVTDQRPALELTPSAQPFSPYYDYFDTLADDMKVAINAAWVTYQWENEIQKVVWDAYQFSNGYLKVVWDHSLANGLGDVALRRIDPYSLYVDPAASCPEDANYFIEARTISLQELDRRFPGAAAKFDIQGYTENVDEMPPTTGYQTSRVPMANPGAISPATSAQYGLPGQSRDHVSQDDTGVTLLEAWLREHTIYDADGVTRVYECWRVVCIAGPHVLLNERAIDISPIERHPYIHYTPEDLGEFYGQSMVELLAPSQLAINRLLAALQHNTELTGNPPIVEDARAGTQRTPWPNQPGGRLTVNQGGKVEWMKVPQLQAMMPELIKFYISEMEKISGLSTISRGLVPGGRAAADVLDSVQESGFVRIRLSLRNLEFAMRTVGQIVCAYIAEFYTESRMVSLVGPNGQKTSLALRSRHFYVPTENGTDEPAIPLKFQVLVYAGSMLPTSRSTRVAEADTLFAMGAIDRQAVLDAHDWPNRQGVLERMSEMDAKGLSQVPNARARGGRTS